MDMFHQDSFRRMGHTTSIWGKSSTRGKGTMALLSPLSVYGSTLTIVSMAVLSLLSLWLYSHNCLYGSILTIVSMALLSQLFLWLYSHNCLYGSTLTIASVSTLTIVSKVMYALLFIRYNYNLDVVLKISHMVGCSHLVSKWKWRL